MSGAEHAQHTSGKVEKSSTEICLFVNNCPCMHGALSGYKNYVLAENVR